MNTVSGPAIKTGPAPKRRARLRVLPLVIFGASLLLTVKLGLLLTPGSKTGEAIAVTQSRAQQAQPGSANAQGANGKPTPLAPANQAGGQANGQAAAPKPAAPGAQAQAQPAAKPAEAKPGDAKTGDAKSAETAPSVAGARDRQVDPITMSQSEIDILQALAERRKQIEERERALQEREALLKAAEQRITEKVNELKAIQAKLEGQVKKQENDRDEQLKRLVKVYENMKPKDAARIFEQLDDAVLLDVAERMKEVKLAPVLASMEPKRATTVTVELAKRRESGRIPGTLPTGG